MSGGTCIRPRCSASTCPCCAQMSSLRTPHMLHPAIFLSFATFRRYDVFGRPRFLLPAGNQCNVVTQSLPLSFLKMCPMYSHFLRLKSSLILSNPALFNSSKLPRCYDLATLSSRSFAVTYEMYRLSFRHHWSSSTSLYHTLLTQFSLMICID